MNMTNNNPFKSMNNQITQNNKINIPNNQINNNIVNNQMLKTNNPVNNNNNNTPTDINDSKNKVKNLYIVFRSQKGTLFSSLANQMIMWAIL